MKRFYEWSPLTFKCAVFAHCIERSIHDFFSSIHFAKTYDNTPLDYTVYKHKSLIRRKLGTVDMTLQENKAVNLSIAAPYVHNIIIEPNETFSFWKCVGKDSARRGFKEGLTISSNKVGSSVGGGLCQFTNLLHWMVVHSPLTITEYHSHDRFDLFPDFNRQVPFGIGTSVFYNYVDYRFKNETDATFQLKVWTDDTYLCGELRTDTPLLTKVHIEVKHESFERIGDNVYRNNEIYLRVNDKETGRCLENLLLKSNHAKVMYEIDESKVTQESNFHNTNGQNE